MIGGLPCTESQIPGDDTADIARRPPGQGNTERPTHQHSLASLIRELLDDDFSQFSRGRYSDLSLLSLFALIHGQWKSPLCQPAYRFVN